MPLNGGLREDCWESLGLQGDATSPSWRKSILNIHWKDWWWSWSSNPLATWYEELIQWKRPWCWERLKAGGEEGDRGWDGWMASPTQWTWIWANSGRWWRTGKAGVLQSVGHKQSDTSQQLNNNKWTISNIQERTEQKRPQNLKSFISCKSCTSFMCLQSVVLFIVFILEPRFQAVTVWNIAGPGWFLTSS